ncbi:hydroxylamine reductase [Balneicella halophila]|nr:hydroxylamine reductase [Balneicella halophila]
MFCYQCQEATKGVACTVVGTCGKKEDLCHLQDLTMYVLKGISIYTTLARKQGIEINDSVNKVVFDGLFMTITNANFDNERFVNFIKDALKVRDEVRESFVNAGGKLPEELHDSAIWTGETEEEFEAKNEDVSVLATENEDIRSLRELVTYGVKGMAAYVEHAYNLGHEKEEIHVFIQRALASTTDDSLSVDDLVGLTLETGKYGVEAMQLLDNANTSSYGNPVATKVNIGVGDKPGILISGHDLRDIEDLLIQTEGKGVDVYTHCEMLPAHAYPAFKKYKHFIGNYGNAWWQQKEEFTAFQGPILFTTNCIVPPSKSSTYADKVFTTGAAGYPGSKHIPDREKGGRKDFSEIIELAKTCPPPKEIETGEINGGFAHNQVIELADKVVDAVKSGAIKKFFVMAGCDGRQNKRNYYTDFASKLPQDTVILTAGCAKFRYNKLALGDIGGIPRVLDAGQCNDSYSLVKIALALKEVFGLDDLNDLPIAYNIAWYEQKAVIVLLALLHLGVKNIKLGPTLPAFLSPNVANVLIENFGISGIGEVEEDMENLLRA